MHKLVFYIIMKEKKLVKADNLHFEAWKEQKGKKLREEEEKKKRYSTGDKLTNIRDGRDKISST